jgi:uncharacterized protein
MVLEGVVTNIVAFGAFVDVGVHQDGLVHVSQLADRYVSDPNVVVKVGQKVRVTVLSVDLQRSRIALSMRSAPDAQRAPAAPNARSGTGQSGQKVRTAAPNKPAPAKPAPGSVAPNGMRFR